MNSDKMICNCYKVRVKDLQKAITSGASSFKEVQKTTKVGKSCEKCLHHAHNVVDDLLAK